MDHAKADQVRRALRRQPKPPWSVLWRAGPPERRAATRATHPRWRVRLIQLQAGWELLWRRRLRRDLAPILRLVACRRGRHHDAHLLADDLVGSPLGDDYPELAVCEVCGRAVEWPNGAPDLLRREDEQGWRRRSGTSAQ
jgi:hypothetical protein